MINKKININTENGGISKKKIVLSVMEIIGKGKHKKTLNKNNKFNKSKVRLPTVY